MSNTRLDHELKQTSAPPRPRASVSAHLEHSGHLELFRNYDEHGVRLARPNTLLIDSAQLESGEALDKEFRAMAGPEIGQFKREMRSRGVGEKEIDNLSDADLLREVMNTVGKEGRLGAGIRCVVSVAISLKDGTPTPSPTRRRARLRHPAPVRAGGRARPAAPVLRPQRGAPVRLPAALGRATFALEAAGPLGIETLHHTCAICPKISQHDY